MIALWGVLVSLVVNPRGICSEYCCLGDANKNGFVNQYDYRAIRDHFGSRHHTGDANCDGIVNQYDYRTSRDHFGAECPTILPTETSTPQIVSTQTPTPDVPNGDIITISLPNLPEGARILRLVRIPAGSFVMGSPESECGRWGTEGPARAVTIGYDFHLADTPITQAQWMALMGDNPSFFSGCGDDCPVENVTWDECKEFVQALNGLGTGHTFRLPSEAEWEYAARAGTTTRFSFGDALECDDGCGDCNLSNQYMWWCGNAGPTTHPVASKLPNPWGLYDVHGNVWEWCEDDWHSNYDCAPNDGSAWVDSPRGAARVIRGGSWYVMSSYCRSASRGSISPCGRYTSRGLRVVAE